MATRRWSYTPNSPGYGITEATGAATVSGPIELTVDLGLVMQAGTVALARQQVLEGVQKIFEQLERTNWPPA